MSLREIKYADTNAFSKLLVDYSQSEKHFSKLISHFPSVDNLKKHVQNFDLLESFCDKAFRILDLPEPFRDKKNQNFGLTSTGRTWAALPEKIDLLRCWPNPSTNGDYSQARYQ